ncbi:conserved protein of unknown function [Candidatus Hydrogenisulfobacillus filiaventi]|uniref:DUF2250 domain-containing protein n=1 Tax=Candidatus Hydrogenisulfobacillus filiaventi TaxID=2707344 RepID=A0A6F8ZDH0_9FIRM|nr:DUF2250 domain-containing protein [Bacillota bacterium]CAB1127918.1 conserved protein of unknown function [Candidatus Hydrogenisulfobacillus filiaventi]
MPADESREAAYPIIGPVEEGTDLLDRKLLAYFKALGPDYAKLIGFRFARPVDEVRARLEHLEALGLVERVEGRIVKYYHRRVKAVKHRNHTYYQLTREGDHFLRRHPTEPPPITHPKR